jgi:hypothetical protein
VSSTNVHAWELPAGPALWFDAEGAAAVAAAATGGWVEVTEPDGDRATFFFNVSTREASWIRPAALM